MMMMLKRVTREGALILALCSGALAQLNQNCTVSVLNRNVRVNPDGSWVLPNVPANFGQVKARATCVQGGVTVSGESAFFTISANTAVNLPAIVLGSASQIPVSLVLTPANGVFTALGQTSQSVVTATYPDGSTRNVAAASTGTNYTTSNPAIVSVSANGLLTAVSTGTVVIQASNDGASGMVTARVTLASADSDGDGIPDSVEAQLGLDPKNPVDGQEDFDRDNLTNFQEFQLGTNLRLADTDGDGLNDGDEVTRGTSPLLRDTDGDGISDGLEVQTSSNPLDAASYNLAAALNSITVTPPSAALVVNSINPTASVQLSVRGDLKDNTTIDLTPRARGTNYTSSNLQICNFGSPDGRVFASAAGACTITVNNNGFQKQVTVTVTDFTPGPVSNLGLSGSIAVDVAGSFAYVVGGSTGLRIVNIANRATPQLVRTVPLTGSASDVRVSGNFAYVAAGAAGLHIVDISTPATASLVATADTPGSATDVAVRGGVAFVADGAAGLQLVNVSTPASPSLLGAISTGSSAIGVDVDPVRQVAAVALGGNGLRLVDVSNPAVPALRGLLSGGDVRDVVIKGTAALLADFSRSFTAVDISNVNSPVLAVSLARQFGGLLQDVAYNGNFAFGADIFFVNGTPVIDITDPLAPAPRPILSFPGDATGTGIAADASYVYLIADSVLYIGQYQQITDNGGVPPTVQITSPLTGPLIQGATITLSANATDDIAVASVTLLANGQPAFTSSAPPYQANFNVPVGIATITFGATAVDYGNNVGAAQNVSLQVIPDPLTTVSGRIVDSGGSPISGATVSSLGRSATSGVGGVFTLSGLPTIQGPITVVAVATVNGTVLGGVTPPSQPIPGGTISVGDLRVTPRPFITSIAPTSVLAGTSVNLSVVGVNLSASTFSLAPAGITVNSATINAAGTTATIGITVSAASKGRFTLIGTNPAGTSDPTPVVGFIRGSTGFNTISVPGSDATADEDRDGLTNAEEIAAKTDPLNINTDGDEIPDGLELALGLDPLDPTNANPPTSGIQKYVSTLTFSIQNNLNPSTGAPGSTQFVSSRTFSILNGLNPSTGASGSTQFVSSRTFSLLNALNPATGVPGSAQFVSGLTFSILNALNPSTGASGSTQFVSSRTFSLLNALNPSTGAVGTMQFVSGRTFSLLNALNPAPTTPSQAFVNSRLFSISNAAPLLSTGLTSNRLTFADIADRIARPWTYQGPGAPIVDRDDDGIPDQDELQVGTNPFDRDTDHDGYPDGLEIGLGSNPLNPNSHPNINPTGFVVSPVFTIGNESLQARNRRQRK